MEAAKTVTTSKNPNIPSLFISYLYFFLLGLALSLQISAIILA